MADMNSYIASYCSRTGMSFDEATSKMESLRNNFRHDDDLDSIWEYKANEELTFEDFSEMMDKGAGASLSDADVEFLFDLFNKDGEGGISGEELSIIVGNKGVVTDFKIWGVLNNGDEKTFKEIWLWYSHWN
jgi:Ca2+-binding EF-hand superfamily protein